MPDNPLCKRIVPLLVVQRDLLEKLAAVTQELDDLCNGKAGIGQRLRQMETAFDDAWCARYAKGRTGIYAWHRQVDTPHMKRFIQRFGLEDLSRRFVAYLQDEDRYLVNARHPFSLFVRNVNTYVASTHAGDERPVGCKHDPPCRNDSEHTTRRQAEMRA